MADAQRDKLVDELNGFLKDHFDFVPLYKVQDIAEKLYMNGWRNIYVTTESTEDTE